MIYSMCIAYQNDIARYFCAAMADLCIPIYTQVLEEVSLPYMHISFEVMKPVFRGKGEHSIKYVLFSSQYSQALVLNVHRILYDTAKAPLHLEHSVDHHAWKSENRVNLIPPVVKETKQHITISWGAEVVTKWVAL